MVNDEKLKALQEYHSKQSITEFLDKITEKAKRNYYCPFHSEKIPSMSVSEDKGVFQCFSCGRNGGLSKLIFYLKELEVPGITYYEAMEEYLKDSPEVCAELGFSSIQDNIYRVQKLDREYTKTLLESLNRHSETKMVDNFDLAPRVESIDDILKRVYLRQKSVTVDND